MILDGDSKGEKALPAVCRRTLREAMLLNGKDLKAKAQCE